MLKSRSRGRLEPPEVYCGTPLGRCPICYEEVDEDEAHETLDGAYAHTSCLPFCAACHDILLHDQCAGGHVLVEPGPITHIMVEEKSGKHYPVRDITFSGRFCGYCFPFVFFPEGEN